MIRNDESGINQQTLDEWNYELDKIDVELLLETDEKIIAKLEKKRDIIKEKLQKAGLDS